MLITQRLSALLQLHLHFQPNTWFQSIKQKQLQDEMRNMKVLEFGASYARGFTVYIFRYMYTVPLETMRCHDATTCLGTTNAEDYMRTLMICIIVSGGEIMDYCQWEDFNPSCPPNSVVVMESAVYGRMEHGRCVKRDYGYVGCTDDVMALSDARCSGRRSCNIGIPDKLFDRVSTCPEDLRRYLKASYSCVPGKYCWYRWRFLLDIRVM